MQEKIEEILDFWFADSGTLKERIKSRSALWWGKDAETDRAIRVRFEAELIALRNGELDHWKDSSRGWLAMIILADQFSRNIYRDDPRAFAQDTIALSLCLEGMQAAIDEQLEPLERVFFYMPLEHSESPGLQRQSLAKFKALAEAGDDFTDFYKYAVAHFEVIEKYGRFPHRNRILGRDSTTAELAYLAKPGAGF